MSEYIILIILIWNIVVFAMYGIDKWKSMNNKWRISENTLILSAFFMGSIGGISGMIVFHHKTKHKKFKVLLPIAVIINIAIIFFVKRYLHMF